MLAPPGIRLGNPERIESRLFTGLGHGHGFADRFHAQLQYADVEWTTQSGSLQERSRPLINSHTALLRGTGTPTFSPNRTIAPFMKSTSVGRLASTSCSMLALCFPGALAPFCTS